jgi:hypothetical protein
MAFYLYFVLQYFLKFLADADGAEFLGTVKVPVSLIKRQYQETFFKSSASLSLSKILD